MPLFPDMVGTAGPARTETLEDRWLMNYAASVLDRNPVYLDNYSNRHLPAHPAYLSHQEWEAISGLHEVLEGLTDDERERGVHSYNDTQLLRPLRSGDTISCTARVQAVQQRRSGSRLTLRIDTVDAGGELVATSVTSTVFRDVPVDGADVGDPPQIARWEFPRPTAPSRTQDLGIDVLAPHIFSECARDYNPIHTDIALATRIDLPGLILHGTATFALALSSLVNHECAKDPTRVRRFGGRLSSMLLCPSNAQIRIYPDNEIRGRYQFDLLTDGGARAIADGFVDLGN
jgi:acyl dehydratase